jgi:DNA recombination protein RmuC
MPSAAVTVFAVFALGVLALGVILFRRRPSSLEHGVPGLLGVLNQSMSAEAALARGELARELGHAREETAAGHLRFQSAVEERMNRFESALTSTLDSARLRADEKSDALHQELLNRQDHIRDESEKNRRLLREDITGALNATNDSVVRAVTDFSAVQRGQMETFGTQMASVVETNDRRFDSMQQMMKQRLMDFELKTLEMLDKTRTGVEQRLEISAREVADRHDRMRDTITTNRQEQREEIASSLRHATESMVAGIARMAMSQAAQLETFGGQIGQLLSGNDSRFEALRTTVETRLAEIRDRNAEQLEQVRVTVDEKLQGTLEKRLGESFKMVSDRLEQVHRGLGEMQSLASGVGDLKRVLGNVKSRGGWGEVQLESLLEQMLAPEQYDKNVRVKADTNQSVEFAICLPSRGDTDEITYLPLDAKFPMEDYQRLSDAQDQGDATAVEGASSALETSVRKCAKDISDKYINPPVTTDFAIMYLPNEGLFAEVIRRPGLIERLQRDCRVSVAGPTTLAAMLNSLQMGFRTLAIEKRTSEVWGVLGAVKTEFSRFGEVLSKVKKNLDTASKTIDDAGVRSRAIERKLRSVERLTDEEAVLVLPAAITPSDDEPSN